MCVVTYIVIVWFDAAQFACEYTNLRMCQLSFCNSCRDKKLAVALREANVAAGDWNRRSNLLLRGVAELAAFKVHSLQRHLEDLSADYTRTLHLQEKVAGDKRQEHRHLDQTLDRYKEVMKSEISKLVGWQQQLLHYSRFLPNPTATTGMYLYLGRFEWIMCC